VLSVLIFSPLNATGSPVIDLAKTVECTSVLDPLSIHHNSAAKSTRCYLVPQLLKCTPNLELKEDGYQNNDICRNRDGGLVSMPLCKTKRRFRYVQSITQRRFLPVTKGSGNDTKTVKQWVDIPFSRRTVTAKLASPQPLHRRGPDMCVFRLLTEIVGMSQTDRSHPTARPAQYPVKKPSKVRPIENGRP
jgi:hypothetical protein